MQMETASERAPFFLYDAFSFVDGDQTQRAPKCHTFGIRLAYALQTAENAALRGWTLVNIITIIGLTVKMAVKP